MGKKDTNGEDKELIPINQPDITYSEIHAVLRILEDKNHALTSSAYTGGHNVQLFEKEVCKFTGSRYAVAVNSGTAALQASLMSLGISIGDEVIIPSLSFVATANAVVSVGATPVFADVWPFNGTINPYDIKKKINSLTKAIIPVHLYGNTADISGLTEIAHEHDLHVIEDACQALGSSYRRTKTGTFFDLGCFSMYPAKVMSAAGEGGFIVTDKKTLYDRLRMIRNHGMVKGNDTQILGLNMRLSEIGAAVERHQLRRLPDFINQRRYNAKLLTRYLAKTPHITNITNEKPDERNNGYLYTIASVFAGTIRKNLLAKGFGATSYYTTPIHKQPFYKAYDSRFLEHTSFLSKYTVSLPIHPKVTPQNIKDMAKIIKETVAKHC